MSPSKGEPGYVPKEEEETEEDTINSVSLHQPPPRHVLETQTP